MKLWGKMFEDKASYAFAVTDGESAVNSVANGSAQLSLKLAADPWEWLHVSASALRSGTIGSNTSPAVAAVWLGEVLPRSFGAGIAAQSFQDGAPIGPGPNKLQGIWILGGDAIVKSPDTAPVALLRRRRRSTRPAGTTYDRDLIYWLAELMVQLRIVSPSLAPAYVAVRASGLGTYSDNRGLPPRHPRRRDRLQHEPARHVRARRRPADRRPHHPEGSVRLPDTSGW